MKIHNPNSRMVFIPDLREGFVVEPGFLHQEQVTIESTPEVVPGQPKGHPALYRITGKLDDGTVITQEAYAGDAVWVFP